MSALISTAFMGYVPDSAVQCGITPYKQSGGLFEALKSYTHSNKGKVNDAVQEIGKSLVKALNGIR